MKENEMGRACNKHESEEKCMQIIDKKKDTDVGGIIVVK
jgi:hypothetical protein